MRKQSSIIVDRKDFLTALNLVKHAVAKEESRPVLTGIRIESKKDGTIDIVGADGFRFGMYTMSAIIDGEFAGVFPLDLLLKAKRSKKEKISIDIIMVDDGPSTARINGKEVELISGPRFNFRQLIPAEFAHKATFDVKELKTALEKVKVVAKKGGDVVRLKTTGENTMRIWAESWYHEMITKEIPAEVENPGEIAMHWKYLRDALKTGANTISFNFQSDVCVFTGKAGLIEVVIPIFIL